MRGSDQRTGELFSYVDLEARVRGDHPLRVIRAVANEALAALSGEFALLYSGSGRPSIAPEKLLRATLLQAFYGIRSERQLMERLEYDLLFRWFVGLGVDDPAFDHSVFSKNRDRLLAGEIAAKFLAAVMARPRVKRLLSSEHFSVDGTLIEAWASMKSFRPKGLSSGDDPGDGGGDPPSPGGRNAEVNFRGEKRSNETHASTTDPDVRLYRKGDGQAAQLCYMGHALMENRHGLVVGALVTRATGTAEREAALALLDRHRPPRRRITLGTDKAYDVEAFVEDLRGRRVTPHVAINGHQTKTGKRRRTAIDGRTIRHRGYASSQRCRKRIEEAFGWIKAAAGFAKTRFRGTERVNAAFTLATAAYNLVRLPKLLAGAVP
jgi:transposase